MCTHERVVLHIASSNPLSFPSVEIQNVPKLTKLLLVLQPEQLSLFPSQKKKTKHDVMWHDVNIAFVAVVCYPLWLACKWRGIAMLWLSRQPYTQRPVQYVPVECVYSTCICSGYPAQCKQKISLTQTQPVTLSAPLVLSFWKDDTVARTPLNNNENGLSGSNASLAQPVSCQCSVGVEWERERESKGMEKTPSFIPEVLMQPSPQWRGRARKTLDLSGPSVP